MLAALQPDYKHAEPTLIGEYVIKTGRPNSARTSALLANNMQQEMIERHSKQGTEDEVTN